MNDYLFFYKLKNVAQYDYETKDVEINLSELESIDDLIEKIQHEDIHKIIDKLKEKITYKQEHKIIFIINWIDEYV